MGDMMIYGKTIKEILKEGWDVYPKWLWALNGFAIAMAFIIILFV